MALANFFGRAAQSIGQVIHSASVADLEKILASTVVEVAYDFDGRAAELEATLDLLIRLLSRLYPTIRLNNLGSTDLNPRLKRVARSINPEIEFTNTDPSITLLLGEKLIRRAGPVVNIGCDGWTAKVSQSRPLAFGDSALAFGAGAAACIGAANAFRHTFASALPNGGNLDIDLELCTLDYGQGATHQKPTTVSHDLGKVHLVGAGAIGNGVLWTLIRSNISAEVVLIDHETVELSNLQRYVLTTQKHIDKAKTRVGQLAASGSRTRIIPRNMKWDQFAEQFADKPETVLTALDSPEDRIAVQASLPLWIGNAWTQTGDLGVSRHFFAGEQACLACLYWPSRHVPSLDEIVASALRMTDHLVTIRQMLYLGDTVTPEFVAEVARRYGIDSSVLLPFAGRRLMDFYQRAICGGLVLEIADARSSTAVEVPLVFQSALAGVMLAAEVTARAMGFRDEGFPAKTVIDLTRPIPKRLSLRVGKTPNCICSDSDFRDQYREKWSTSARPVTN